MTEFVHFYLLVYRTIVNNWCLDQDGFDETFISTKKTDSGISKWNR